MKRGFLFKHKKLVSAVAIILLACISSCAIYLGDFYQADMEAISNFVCENEVEMKTNEQGHLVFESDAADTGFIFYPGGKVEYTSYIPLMRALSAEGILCILVEMPFNLAVFDINAAEGIQEQYPQIEEWYIGGHSLGGSMAASYLSKEFLQFEGLVLLGSYSTVDLSETELEVLSVYGSEDRVMIQEKYEENKMNLPSTFTEVVIDGGCHSYFGMYGAQEGDGTPSIKNEDQIAQTVDAIMSML